MSTSDEITLSVRQLSGQYKTHQQDQPLVFNKYEKWDISPSCGKMSCGGR
jgi:hypothetical protein